MKSKLFALCFAGVLAVAGCSSDGGGEGNATGGTTSTGGHTQTGGSGGGAGGTSGSGGTTSSGGSATGGTTSSGGSVGSGGSGSGGSAPVTGGKTGSGGTAGAATGGTSANGGSATGGTTANGGSGGRDGGVDAQGGAGGRDGGQGGTVATGGSTPNGGSGGNGGAVTPSASGYPAAGASGQAKPTGTGATLTVLNWAGFKGAVTFSFDDGNSSQISNYPALQALNDKGNNARYTFYLVTSWSNATNAVWKTAVADGHEIGNHTASHNSSASGSDIDTAESWIKTNLKYTAYTMAAPNGDDSYQTAAQGKFLINREVDNGSIGPTDDPNAKGGAKNAPLRLRLPTVLPAANATASAITSPITSAQSAGKWVTFCIHGFTGDSSAYNAFAFSEMKTAITNAKNMGNMWIDTMENVGAYWVAAYAFSKMTATTSGTDKTWTWKTSDFADVFPPGKYLRVKTDGGVLKQGDTALAWDDHGYYEVALDKGTLTLSAQ